MYVLQLLLRYFFGSYYHNILMKTQNQADNFGWSTWYLRLNNYVILTYFALRL